MFPRPTRTSLPGSLATLVAGSTGRWFNRAPWRRWLGFVVFGWFLVRDLLFVHGPARWIGVGGSVLFLVGGGWVNWRLARIHKWLCAHPSARNEGG